MTRGLTGIRLDWLQKSGNADLRCTISVTAYFEARGGPFAYDVHQLAGIRPAFVNIGHAPVIQR